MRDLVTNDDRVLDRFAAPGVVANGQLFFLVRAVAAPDDARNGIWRHAL